MDICTFTEVMQHVVPISLSLAENWKIKWNKNKLAMQNFLILYSSCFALKLTVGKEMTSSMD